MLLFWYLSLLSSAFASPLLPASDATCPACPICPTVSTEHFLVTRATTYPATDTSPTFNTRYRSTIEIIWSCLTIIFASTWICVHPNVAGYKTTMWQRLWQRLKLFALAIFAPELLAVFAFFQWKGCRELHRDPKWQQELLNAAPSPAADRGESEEGNVEEDGLDSEKCGLTGRATEAKNPSWLARVFTQICSLGAAKDAEWTLTHAHFLQMGGIVFKDPGSGDTGFKQLQDWTDQDIKNFLALRLPESVILDKSKASALAKTLVVMQVLWFVIQTIARALEGLPITHLEVVCLAFTLFNVGMYVCWWDKPLDVESPLEVSGPPGRKTDDIDVFNRVLGTLWGGLNSLPIGEWIYSPRTKLYPSTYCYSQGCDWDSVLNMYFSGHYGTLGGAFTLALSLTSVAFGALHAIGWSLYSPSQAERLLWRISCLIMVSYPLVPLVILPLGILLDDHVPTPGTEVYTTLTAFISFLGAIAYVGARCILLVLPFLELRDLPLLAHQTVSWSNFLPHI